MGEPDQSRSGEESSNDGEGRGRRSVGGLSLVQGAGTTPLQTTRRAREEEIEAVDALEASRAAVSRLETDLQEAEHAAERASKGVRAIISALLKPVAERMREEASALRVQYLTRMYAVAAMAEQLDGISYLRFDISEAENRQLRATIGQSWSDAIWRSSGQLGQIAGPRRRIAKCPPMP